MKVALAGHDDETFGPPPEIPRTAIAQKLDTPDDKPAEH